MNMYTNTKKSKKFILVLVLILLFTFCYPKQVRAVNASDFIANISSFFFMLEKGIINFLNDTFCDEEHEFRLTDSTNSQVLFTPENIIRGKFLLFDANIFKNITDGDYYDRFEWLIGSDYVDNMIGDDFPEGAKETLRNTIAGWYYSLRNFAIVALLSVLVYVGIRMITSTLSQDKAKYKIMFKDWIIALCLLMVMHYIMIGILNATDMITKAIGVSGEGGTLTANIMLLIQNINEDGNSDRTCGRDDCRYEDGINHYYVSDAFAQEILLMGIILLTFIFAWKYLKREFTIIFLILLGPISCITYPIDKISDGKAQAFNKWLTEFIYNVLVQPFHLLLYTVLCGSAVELANRNVLYGLACLAMLIPAEKFVKEMFGFKDKLGGGPLAAASFGAIGSQLLNKMKGGSSSGGNGSGDNNTSTPDIVKNKDIDPSVLAGEGNSDPSGSNTPETNTRREARNPVGAEETGPESEVIDTKDEEEIDADSEVINPRGEEDTGPESEVIDTKDEEEADAEPEERKPSDEEKAGSNNVGEKEKTNKRNIKDKVGNAVRTIKNRQELRATNKWGTADKKERWKRRVKKGAKTGIRVAGGVAGATVGAAVGLLSGKGIAAGAAAGAALGGRAYKAAEKVGSVVGDYRDAFRSPEQREAHAEKLALDEFMTNKKQWDKAVLNFRAKNGRDPSAEELKQEMTDRYRLSRWGLSNEDINKSIGKYQEINNDALENEARNANITDTRLAELKEEAGGEENLNNKKYRDLLEKELITKLGNEKGNKAIEKARNVAGNQAALASQLGNRYKGKFEKESDMQGALNALTQRFVNSGVTDRDVAERKAREVLTQAAEINEETVQLPPERIPETFISQMLSARGITNPTEQEIRQEEIIHQTLQDNGFNENDIRLISNIGARSQSDFRTIVNKVVKVKTDYESNGKTKKQIEKIVGANATQEQINQEIIERVEIQEEFGIQGRNADLKVDAIRTFEKADGVNKSQRAIGAKTVKKEISKKDKYEMTEKDKIFAKKYENIVNSSKTELEKYINDASSNINPIQTFDN